MPTQITTAYINIVASRQKAKEFSKEGEPDSSQEEKMEDTEVENFKRSCNKVS